MFKRPVIIVHMITWLLLSANAEPAGDASTNEVSKDASLQRELEELKTHFDEMMNEIRNANKGVLKQADRSRILSIKLVNLTGELTMLKRADFKRHQRMKKIRARMILQDQRLDACKCPKLSSNDPSLYEDESDFDYGSYNNRYTPYPTGNRNYYDKPTKKKSKDRKRGKNRRKSSNKRSKKHRKNRKNRGNNDKSSRISGLKDFSSKKSYQDYDDSDAYGQVSYGHETYFGSGSDYLMPGMEPGYGTQVDMEKESAFKPRGSSRIFLTTGSSNSTEILNLNSGLRSRDPSCPSVLAPYPLAVQGAVGTFMSEKVIVCGGRSSIEKYHSDCYAYDVGVNTWKKEAAMRETRFQATGVMIDSRRWWVTGGFSGQHVYNETEVFEEGIGFSRGPDLPGKTFQHCLIKVNATHVFTVGGYPYSRNAWLLDFDANHWTVQKPIANLRDAPHCALVQRNSGKVEVVVAGGSLPGSELSTEIFSVTDNRWRTGANLPQAIIYGVSVQYANTLVILGGQQMGGEMTDLDTIFTYDPEKELWRKKDKRLRVRRKSFVAVTLPEFFTCSASRKPGNKEHSKEKDSEFFG